MTERQLLGLIERVPARATGRVSYNLRDDRGAPAGRLDPIPDRGGGYLGVYDVSDGGSGPAAFSVFLGHSSDLLHWQRVRMLDPGANSATLRRIPGGVGYLLAEEKYSAAHPYDHIRVRYYRTLRDLLHGRFQAQTDLPRRYSPYVDGTPDFESIAWRDGPTHSVLRIGFHYLPTGTGFGHQGPDREAIGILRGFRRWRTLRDRIVDAALDTAGLRGQHGARRQFEFDGRWWRVYEAQVSYSLGGFGNWRIALYDLARHHIQPLAIHTASGTFTTSFGDPIVQVEPAPAGRGRVLVVTMFVFFAGVGEGGELLYEQPVNA